MYSETLQRGTVSSTPVRERDPNCIEMHLKSIEAELAESINSAANLADKLCYATVEGQNKTPGPNAPPTPMNVQARLEQIANAVRCLNQELGRSHSAISG